MRHLVFFADIYLLHHESGPLNFKVNSPEDIRLSFLIRLHKNILDMSHTNKFTINQNITLH